MRRERGLWIGSICLTAVVAVGAVSTSVLQDNQIRGLQNTVNQQTQELGVQNVQLQELKASLGQAETRQAALATQVQRRLRRHR